MILAARPVRSRRSKIQETTRAPVHSATTPYSETANDPIEGASTAIASHVHVRRGLFGGYHGATFSDETIS